MKHLALIVALMLAGCASHDVVVKPVETQTVDVPVAQPCPKQVDPDNPPVFPANDAAMKNLPYPRATADLKKDPKSATAKAQVDANAYYLLQLMAADRLATRAWIGQLGANLKGCQK